MKIDTRIIVIFAVILIVLSIVPAAVATDDTRARGMGSVRSPKNATNVSWGSVPSPATISSDPVQKAPGTRGTTSRTYTIIPSAGSKGEIFPSDQQKLDAGKNKAFSIKPNDGFTIADVLVDGKSVGAVSTYTFANVNSNHTLSATFKKGVVENQKLVSNFSTPFSGTGKIIRANITTFYWNGKGHIYLTGGNGYLNTYADDAFDVSVDGSSLSFSRPGHTIYSGIPEITTICHPGVNNLTLDIRDIYGSPVGCGETWLWFDHIFSANFTGTPTTGPAPLSVRFTDTSTGLPNSRRSTSWIWNFGDGKTSRLQNPTHTYTTPGTYTVNLTVRSPDGSMTATKAGYVVVKESNPKLVVTVRDFNTLKVISDAKICLYDFVHSAGTHIERQNITTSNGTAVFTTSGSSHQYPLVNGTVYGIFASASGYQEIKKDVTITSDEQNVEFKLKKNKPELSDYSYSITFAELADTPENLSVEINSVRTFDNALKNVAGWRLEFYHGDNNLSKADFGAYGGGLNEATFHYHIGHGTELFKCLELPDDKVVCPSDVRKKWGNKNKWVFLQSCSALNNSEWAAALDTSHGIFGYETTVTANGGVIHDFMKYAMDDRMSLYDAYRKATVDNLNGNVIGAVIFHNEEQLYGDHLPGYGTVEPDCDPDEKPIRIKWEC